MTVALYGSISMAAVLSRFAALPVIALATSALAQDMPSDWSVFRDPERKVTMAYTDFDAGIGLQVRCVDGGLEAIVSGLPADEADTRIIGVRFPKDERLYDQQWNVAIDTTVAVSNLPAPFARSLREGGELQLRIAGGGEGGRNLRYVLNLPASSGAIDSILTECDRPLVDPRDAAWATLGDDGLPTQLQWLKRPRPTYPARPKYSRGFAVVSCIADPRGHPQDCVVETEHPRDGGFGRETLSAAREARLTNTLNPDAPITPSRFTFRAIYNLVDAPALSTPSRIRKPN